MTREQMINTLVLLGWEPYTIRSVVRMNGNLIAYAEENVRRCAIELTPEKIAGPDSEGRLPSWESIEELARIYDRVMEWNERQ